MQSNGSSVLFEPGVPARNGEGPTTAGGPTANGGGQTGSTETWVLFAIDSQKYGLQITEVERILRAVEVKPLPQSPPHVMGIINMQGTILPVIDLQVLPGSSPAPHPPGRPLHRGSYPHHHRRTAGGRRPGLGGGGLGHRGRRWRRPATAYLRRIVPLGHEVIYALDLERVVFGDESPQDSGLISALEGMGRG